MWRGGPAPTVTACTAAAAAAAAAAACPYAYCERTPHGSYRQTRAMSCGPTAAAEMVSRLGGTPDLARLVDGCLPLDDEARPDKTAPDALDRGDGFEGNGFEHAITAQARCVTWAHGEREDRCAAEAVARSAPDNPAMLVVRHPGGGQH